MCKQVMDDINKFSGEYRFLSNFWPAPIIFEGVIYPSSEHLYQALKTVIPEEREQVRNTATAALAKRLGKQLSLRDDWNDDLKLKNMEIVVRAKFTQHPDLAEKLKNTSPHNLIEGNWWGDTFFGVDQKTSKGENHLGKILMKIRSELLLAAVLVAAALRIDNKALIELAQRPENAPPESWWNSDDDPFS